MEEKIKSGKYRHEIQNIGEISGDTYITKYVMDLSIIPVITEIRIYPDEKGHFGIPAEYRSDVTYPEFQHSKYCCIQCHEKQDDRRTRRTSISCVIQWDFSA